MLVVRWDEILSLYGPPSVAGKATKVSVLNWSLGGIARVMRGTNVATQYFSDLTCAKLPVRKASPPLTPHDRARDSYTFSMVRSVRSRIWNFKLIEPPNNIHKTIDKQVTESEWGYATYRCKHGVYNNGIMEVIFTAQGHALDGLVTRSARKESIATIHKSSMTIKVRRKNVTHGITFIRAWKVT